MFGYCIWYRIKDDKLNSFIKFLATIFNTEHFPAHITIQSKLSHNDSHILYKKMVKKNIPFFTQHGNIYQTNHNNFYALQMDYLMNGNIEIRNYHVSIAYF